MELDDIEVPTVPEYVKAFRAIESRITPNQLRMLLFHHRAPARVVSATRLAQEAGFEGHSGANLQYGLLASELLRQLGIELPETVKSGILVDFVNPEFAGNQEWLWVMRPNVAEALEELRWAPRISHLLYPSDALEVPGA
jgi:hypothetical protein